MTREELSYEPPPSPGAVLSYPQRDTTVCTVTGKIDTGTTPALRDVLTQAVHDDNAHLVIDLSTITFIDSTGLYALFATRHKHNRGGNGHLAVVIDSSSQAIPRLYAVALDVIFDLHDDLAGALRACASAGPESGP
ncbi:MAG: STAS domain-containing protein [Pseudonocardiaceae bacterium]